MSRTEVLNEVDYHKHSAVGSSQLKTILKSVGLYKWQQCQPREVTKAMNFGTCFHLAVLEPDRFMNEVVTMPHFEGTGMRARKDSFMTENHGKLFLTAEEKADLLLMLKSLRDNSVAYNLLLGGVPELSYFWTDPETGIECKVRPDFRRNSGVLVDIKTTGDASIEEFSRSVLNYGYHISGSFYLEGVSKVLGQTFDKFCLIAVEKTAPYGIGIYELDFGTLEKGNELVRRALGKLHSANQLNHYPIYSENIEPINIPAYGFNL